jgi:hypothetical protein
VRQDALRRQPDKPREQSRQNEEDKGIETGAEPITRIPKTAQHMFDGRHGALKLFAQ